MSEQQLPTEHSMHRAAQLWCLPTTERFVMIPELATETARLLDTMIPMPERDDETWLSNLTMACIDEGVPRDQAERIAARFMGWLTIKDNEAFKDK